MPIREIKGLVGQKKGSNIEDHVERLRAKRQCGFLNQSNNVIYYEQFSQSIESVCLCMLCRANPQCPILVRHCGILAHQFYAINLVLVGL